MPKITIRENDLTTPGSRQTSSNVVYVPGIAKDKTLPKDFEPQRPRLYTNLADFQADFGHVPATIAYYNAATAQTIPTLFETWSTFDTGYIYATELLRLGTPVLYDCLVSTKDAITNPNADAERYSIEKILERLGNRFTQTSSDFYTRLMDKGLNDIKFFSNGGYVSQAINDGLINVAKTRTDSVAVVDYPYQETFTAMFTDETSFKNNHLTKVTSKTDDSLKYAAMFGPWATYTPICLNFKDANGNKNTHTEIELPASFGYLMATATALSNGANNWQAMAGAKRGRIPFLKTLKETLTETVMEKMQTKENIAVNPITVINPFGVLVWGNRTLFDNSTKGGLTASSFLNIRNMCSDISKNVWSASRQLTFE